MAIKIEEWVDGDVLTANDLNDSFGGVMRGVAEQANKTLKAAGAYENGGVTAAENYTTASGINGTVTTGSSTGVFDTDNYSLIKTGVTNSFSQNSLGANVGSAYITVNILSNGYFSRIPFYISGTASVRVDIEQNGVILATKTSGSVSNASSVTFELNDYSSVLNTTDGSVTITITKVSGTGSIEGGQNTSYTGSLISVPSQVVFTGTNFIFTEYVSNTSGTVFCDTNTITVDSDVKAIQIYSDHETPTDTSITVDVGDGTSTLLSAQTFDSNGFTGVKALSGVTSGTLELTFNLNTTNTSVTPKQYGWGVYLIRD